MNIAHFQDLPGVLCRYLACAGEHIRVAMCWFSHKDIFDILITRLQAGVRVELLLEYDTQNIRDNGLDFQQLIRNGGALYACRETGLMHHKFALVDEHLLLTNSFNWTYNSNAENLLITDDAIITAAFGEEFERLRTFSSRIFKVKKEEAKVFSTYPLFENTRFHLAGLRKQISRGANVWFVRLEKIIIAKELVFRENILPFDAHNLLGPCWTTWRMWDETPFNEELERLKSVHSPAILRDLRCWALRMKKGDIVLAAESKKQVLAVGVVQSLPQRSGDKRFSSYRSVQWLKILADKPYRIDGEAPAAALARFRGSGLKLLQEVFDES